MRIRIGKNHFAKLYEEVRGMCPLCGKVLIDDSGNRLNSRAEAAHIYPHSPTNEEIKLLKDAPRLSQDPENLDNLILLCSNDHKMFDHPRTVDGYMKLYNLKKQLLDNAAGKEYYEKHSIESDLFIILEKLGSHIISDASIKLSYDAIKVMDKMKDTESVLIKNTISQHVNDYYLVIKDFLKELEKDHGGVSDLIAAEIKTCYLDLKKNCFTQESIYYHLVEWLNAKTANAYIYATPIIIAYYIQNCEVFTNDMPQQSR
ncbi:HNH endonuclease [Ruminococcaceae bacterium OttesenSCG-928-A16]|nr:HNH endonuclease [Ruminococcaceae bacterium OttesenSCG-928-A16]